MSGRTSSSVIDEIRRKGTAAPPEEEVRAAVESERQARTHPAMLVVCKKNGDELLLAYPLLRHVWKREGGSIWELVFDDYKVIIRGRNLGDKLRDLLRLQRLSALREGNLIEDELTSEDKAFIESIDIREKEEA
jgi:hypothetical protein